MTPEALKIQVTNGGTCSYIKKEMDKVIQSLFRRLGLNSLIRMDYY